MASGWTKSLLSNKCLAALAPGTSSPSTAVVRNTLFPQTIGDECERPSIAVFHLMFLVGVHSDGRFFSFEIPDPSGPLHCGQFPADALPASELSPAPVKEMPTMSVKAMRRDSFMFLIPLISFSSRIPSFPRTHICVRPSARSAFHPKSPAWPSLLRRQDSSPVTRTSVRLSRQTR